MSQFKNLWVVLAASGSEPPERLTVRADAASVVDGALVFAQLEPPRMLRAFAPGHWRSVFLWELNEHNDFHIWEDE